MAKANFGEWGAFTAKNSIRYTKNNKMVGKDTVPPEVIAFLDKKLTPAATPTRPVLTDEQKAELRAASLEVKPELQATPEKLQEDAAALTPDDFEPEYLIPASEEDKKLAAELENIVADTIQQPDFLETVSIHTAPLEDITRALYERFGIYTVYIRQLPNPDEINPLTGEPFTKYHQGIAYQAAIAAQNRGILDRPAEEGRRMIDEGRAASANFQVDPVPTTMGEARRANSFDFRTSARGQENRAVTEIVHVKGDDGLMHAVQREIPRGQTGEFNGASSRYDAEEDEQIVVPSIGKQVIRPDW